MIEKPQPRTEDSDESEKPLTTHEAGRIAGVSHTSIVRAVRDGELSRPIFAADVIAWAESRLNRGVRGDVMKRLDRIDWGE